MAEDEKKTNDNNWVDLGWQDECVIDFFVKTRISGMDYPAWGGMGKTKALVDDWFDRHKAGEKFTKLSTTYPLPDAIHSGSGSIHLAIPFEQCENLEYIRIRNHAKSRSWYGKIYNFSQVNANSTRIYFQIDWVATYWDTLGFGVAHVSRRSEKAKDKVFSNNLSDGFPVPTYNANISLADLGYGTMDISLTDYISEIVFGGKTREARQDNVTYCMLTDFDQNGEFVNNAFFQYQAGGMIGGVLWTAHDIQKFQKHLKKVVHLNRKFLIYGIPLLSSIKQCYLVPRIVQKDEVKEDNNKQTAGTDVKGDRRPVYPLSGIEGNKYLKLTPINDLINLKDFYRKTKQIDGEVFLDYEFQNKKILNYINYIFAGQSGGFFINPRELPDPKVLRVFLRLTGSPEGNMQLAVFPRGVSYNLDEASSLIGAKVVQTYSWPTLYLAGMTSNQFGGGFGSVANHHYNGKSMWDKRAFSFIAGINPITIGYNLFKS